MSAVPAVKTALKSQVIETPSWGYGNSGTRFKVFAQDGVPRDPFEKLDDAARVLAATGVAPVVSLHIAPRPVSAAPGPAGAPSRPVPLSALSALPPLN